MIHKLISIFHGHGTEERRQAKNAYHRTVKAVQETERVVINALKEKHSIIAERFTSKIRPQEVEAEVVEDNNADYKK